MVLFRGVIKQSSHPRCHINQICHSETDSDLGVEDATIIGIGNVTMSLSGLRRMMGNRVLFVACRLGIRNRCAVVERGTGGARLVLWWFVHGKL